MLRLARPRLAYAVLGILTLLGPASPAPAQSVAPESITRDAEGRVTVRAARLTSPLRIDGALDEPLYSSTRPISGFTQNEPRYSSPMTERTEVWVAFDDDNIYVSVKAWESNPERMVASEMRRDSTNVVQSENFAFALDTFHDRRNAFIFQFNPVGGRMDGQSTNEGQYNGDVNPVWQMAVGRFDGGWTGEAAVPFKSLRYPPGRDQVWGFQSRRINRWRNEVGFLTPMFRGAGNRGIFFASQYGTLVGIEAPANGHLLELKPYAISDLTTNLAASPPVRNTASGDVGLDAKYALTKNLTADFTVNTDFAQVEVDEQQVNLTRFSLFFPEKRDFFLENQGFFQFASDATVGGNGTSGLSGTSNATSLTPVLFYSRRIGLQSERDIPIMAGARTSGRVGRFTVGVLNIQARKREDQDFSLPATNFTVARVKRDILRRSSIGAIVTGRSNAIVAPGAAESYGVDGTFVFFENLAFDTFWAKTATPGQTGGDTSYRANMNYGGDRWAVNLERMMIGEHFNPEVGFVRRNDMARTFGLVRFSPRPGRHVPGVRKFTWEGSLDYIENTHGHRETQAAHGLFRTEFQNSDSFAVGYTDSYEYLKAPFAIGGVSIPAGAGYDFGAWNLDWISGRQHRLSGLFSLEHGSFYGGTRTGFSYTQARVSVTSHLSIEPGVTVNRVILPYGSFTQQLVTSRVTFTSTPLMFTSALMQYNADTHSLSTNLRFRWEYTPGSELFVVFNDSRDTLVRGFPELQSRAVIVKVNKLLRF